MHVKRKQHSRLRKKLFVVICCREVQYVVLSNIASMSVNRKVCSIFLITRIQSSVIYYELSFDRTSIN